MKTFDEIALPFLAKVGGEFVLTEKGARKAAIIYASQAIDEAAKKADIQMIEYTDEWEVNKASILNVKTSLK